MATSRPFAFNTGSTITGTEQLGDLAIGVDQERYDEDFGGVKWWMGPDEDLGYIICRPNVTGNQPNPVAIPAYVGFLRSEQKTEVSFVNLVNTVYGQSFTTGNECQTYLNNNGYWTSWVSSLKLYLDASNPNSYSGVGTTWYDLSGNGNDVEMVNSGSITWNNSGPTYFSTGSNGWFNNPLGSNLPTGNTSYTLIVWVQLDNIWSSNGFMSIGPFGIPNQSNAFRAGTTNQLINYWWGNDLSVTSSVSPANGWFNAIAKYDGVTRSIWVNGVLVGSDTPLGHNVTNNSLQIAKTYDNEFLNGNIGEVLIYDTALSDANILQYFNDTFPKYFNVTPTPTPTPTLTITPTITPTPTSSPIPVTGYGFNLVALPYNFPSSGNTIMNSAGGITTGSTNPNVLATGSRGLYWNSIDSDGVDRTNYFSGFTGQSITITMSQTGSTAIYSGDTNSLKQWIQSGPGTGFVFGAGIGVPPSNTPSGTAVLIQSATTEWTIGLPVYISVVVNPGITPTPTPTNTVTPTVTPTNTPTVTPTISVTPTPSPTPNIVTSGLVIQLDAYNNTSYPGSGTTVFDLTGSFNHTLTNAPYTELNTIKCFDCNGAVNTNIRVIGTGPTLQTSGYTYISWVRLRNDTTYWRTLYRTAPNDHPLLVAVGSNDLGFYDNNTSSFINSTYDVSPIVDTWVQLTVVANSTGSTYYVNTTQVGNTVPYTAGGNRHDYWGSIAGQPSGYVANMYYYNRALSLAEITQQYNYLAPRFVEPTPTPTVTPTPTITPTNTPTPTTSPVPTIQSFTTVGTTSWTAPAGVTSVEYLVVGGGGGGGNAYDNSAGGGGGAGMVLSGTTSVTPGQSYTVTVGAGGLGGAGTYPGSYDGASGGTSVFSTITAIGGGQGWGTRKNQATIGAAQVGDTTAPTGGGGGGGGTGGKGGGGATGNGTTNSGATGGSGGAGLTSSISGFARIYGVGGASANSGSANGSANGTANRGNGGQAAGAPSGSGRNGGTGGSGIVILKY